MDEARIDIDVTSLAGSQLAGKRCAVCRADWYVQSLSGPGFTIPHRSVIILKPGQAPVEVQVCFAHGLISSET